MVKESVIRLMSRLASEHQAVNLSMGFTDEPPEYEMVWGAMTAMLGGTEPGIAQLQRLSLRDVRKMMKLDNDKFLDSNLTDVMRTLRGTSDVFNQYCIPYGLVELRNAIADYTERFQGYRPDPETQIMVSSGATEATTSVLLTICKPGDEIIVVQPFHEMYPAHARVLGLMTKYITLREDPKAKTWRLDEAELKKAITRKTKALILNTPHNPTGKVFTRKELQSIGEICLQNNVLVISDEIYEHFAYGRRRHVSMASIPEMRDQTIVINAISKTGNATGWRVGWVICPPRFTPEMRSIHDPLVIQAATPLQKGAVKLLQQKDTFFHDIGKHHLSKRAIVVDALEAAGFKVSPPEGAYYIMADYSSVPALRGLSPTDAAVYLIKNVGVASVPGDNFYAVGDFGNRYLRFAFCKNDQTLHEAAKRLKKLKPK